MNKPKILVSALEPSSNLHLSELMKYLKDEVTLLGVFDESLGKPLYSPKDFSAMGFVDVGKKLGFFLRANKELAALAKQADKILLMDSSSFNIPLAKKIKQSGNVAPIYYYILPQVWAWKQWRAKKIEANCDKLLAILPFETKFYKSKAQYVGHPLLDEIPHSRNEPTHTKSAQEHPKPNGVVFMPGSRRGEIKRMFPEFLKVAKALQGVQKTLVVPKFFANENLESIYGDLDGFEISFDTKQALWNADFAFICSGTATLESALIGTPFVLGYKTAWLDYTIARTFVNLNFIGLANIFYEAMHNTPKAQMHIELIQHQMNAKNLLLAYEKFDRNDFYRKSLELRNYLKNGSALNVANIIRG